MTNAANDQPVPVGVKVANGILLLWNLFGLTIFLLTVTVFRSREALAEAGLNEQQIEITLGTPTWVNIAFGTAVITGSLGCLCLVLKKKAAIVLLVVSLLAVLTQNTYMYFLSDTIAQMGVGASHFVIAGAVFLVPYAVWCARRRWLI